MMDYAAEREVMVDSQVRPNDAPNLEVQDAMRRIPRETFVPSDKRYLAYADASVPYAPGRWLMSPMIVARLINAVAPRQGERALVIAGPYAAAVLEALGLLVTRLDDGDLRNIQGDWPLIFSEGAVPRAPREWLNALAPGGRLGVVECKGPVGRGVLYLRSDQGVGARTLFDCTAPVMPEFVDHPGFVF